MLLKLCDADADDAFQIYGEREDICLFAWHRSRSDTPSNMGYAADSDQASKPFGALLPGDRTIHSLTIADICRKWRSGELCRATQ